MRDVLLHPVHGRGQILVRRRPGVLRGQPIIDIDADHALLRQYIRQHGAPLLFQHKARCRLIALDPPKRCGARRRSLAVSGTTFPFRADQVGRLMVSFPPSPFLQPRVRPDDAAAVHTMRGLKDGTGTSSGHGSTASTTP